MTTPNEELRDKLLDAALDHVAFDGWSDATFRAALDDTGTDIGLARGLFPRGAMDLALAYHARGDAAMLEQIRAADFTGMKFRDKIAAAVRFRLQAATDKEVVRRGTTLFALPQHAPDGARAIWTTCDLIWDALGDSSTDYNWYTKRATLSGVYSATLLFWLGDDSPDHQATWAFLGRRVDNVMQIEKLKADVNKNPLLKPLLAAPNWLLGQIKAPDRGQRADLPGWVAPRR